MSGRPDDLTAIDAASWAEALRRDQVLRPLAESSSPVSRSEASTVASRRGISQRWAFALLRRLRADLRTSAMLSRDRGRPRGLRLLQAEVEAVVEDQVKGYYATAQKPSKQSLSRQSGASAASMACGPPGNETVRRRLRATDPVAIAAGRQGRSGVLPPATFNGLKLVDRSLWYALHSLGFPGDGPGQNIHPNPRVEALGARDHWAAERTMRQPLSVPAVQQALNSVRITFRHLRQEEANRQTV